MVLLLVVGMAGGFTWTYFTDTETSTNNYFQAGTLDLMVDNENPWTSTAITASALEPGAGITPVDLDVENLGDLMGDLYYRFTNMSGTGSATSEPECSAESGTWTSPSGPCGGGWVPVDNVQTMISFDVDWNGGNIYSGTLSAAPSTWTLLQDDFVASGTGTFTLNGTLSAATTNEYQGDRAEFDIEIGLAQDGQSL